MKLKLQKKVMFTLIVILLILATGFFGYKKYEENKWSKCFDWALENYEKITLLSPDHECYEAYKDVKLLLEAK